MSTVIGVLIGVAGTLAVSALQFWFNRHQRERDRLMQLRRDVYLEAADGLAATVDYMTQQARLGEPLGNAALPPSASAWVFKTYLVAGVDALNAIQDAGAVVAEATMDLVVHRVQITKIDDDIKRANTAIDGLRRRQEDLRAEATVVDRDPASEGTDQRRQGIVDQYESSSTSLAAEFSKLETLYGAHAVALRQFLQHLADLGLAIQQPIRAAMLAARSELEMPLDRAKFETAAQQRDARMSAKVAELARLIELPTDEQQAEISGISPFLS